MKLSLGKALNLGRYHHKCGDLIKAKNLYTAVLKAFPDNKTAQASLRKIELELLATQAPEHEQLLVDKVRRLYDAAKMEPAKLAARELISLKPDHPIAWSILGGAELALDNYRQAETAFRKVLSLLPDDPHVCNNFATTLNANYKYHEAIEYFQKATKVKKDFIEPYIGLANALQSINRLDDAVFAINGALRINPADGRALNILGTIQLKRGNNQEAVNALQKAIESPNYNSDAHRQLSQLIHYKEGHPHIIQVEKIIKNATLTRYETCQLHFAYAKMQDDLGYLEQAFQYYSSAGKIRKEMLGYNIAHDVDHFEEIKNYYGSIREFANIEWRSEPNRHPIFIVGMPRSGSSLLEQIISSHSRVSAAGELSYVHNAGKQLVEKKLHDIRNLKILRDHYIEKLEKIGRCSDFVTDKMPHNFKYIGIIKKIFPNSQIIHIKRDAGAVCWSNFTQYFPAPELAYSFDIDDVVKYYKLYADLMDFWRSEFPNDIYEIDYDQLVSDPEPHIRSLMSHLGLDWEDACLAPHENQRIVFTASREQVKKKIYTGSSLAWKKFEPYLDGAFDELYQ